MKYTPEEATHFSALQTAFENYLEGNPNFDILYSAKRGYYHVQRDIKSATAKPLRSPEDLFFWLLIELSSDVRDLFLCGEHIDVEMYPEEIQETRNRLQPFLDRLPEDLRAHYAAEADAFFLHCNDDSRGGRWQPISSE